MTVGVVLEAMRALMPVVVLRGLTGVGEVRPKTVRGLKGAEIWAGDSLEWLWWIVLDWARCRSLPERRYRRDIVDASVIIWGYGTSPVLSVNKECSSLTPTRTF